MSVVHGNRGLPLGLALAAFGLGRRRRPRTETQGKASIAAFTRCGAVSGPATAANRQAAATLLVPQ